MFTFVDEGVYFLNEIKGMNPIIVYRPGDMEKAAADVLSSAFSYAGQHLYSCSKVIVTADEENDFVRMLAGKAKDFRVSEAAARRSLKRLEAAGLLRGYLIGPHRRAWRSPEILDLMDDVVSALGRRTQPGTR